MEGFAKEAAQRLPLAEAVLRMFHFVCDAETLQRLYDEHRGRTYEKVISFPLMVRLISDALLEHEGSGHKSFRQAEEKGELEASIRAAYDKLGRLPLAVSMAFLAEGAARLRELFPQQVAGQTPASLASLEVLVHDGKKIKHLEKRLTALRKVNGHVLGGKLVVARSMATGMAVAMGACEDGESADSPLVPLLLEQVRGVTPGPRLHVGDRQFCDLNQARLFTDQEDHFLVRWNQRLHFHRDDDWETIVGKDRRGRTYREDWGWIGSESDGRRRYVRRIHLEIPDGEDVILLTDLIDPDLYPADDLLEVYLQRWDIEGMFQQVTEVFHLKSLIGSTPEATVFQASFCFLLYNMIQVARAWVADAQQMKPTEISSENLFYDIRHELIAWTKLIPPNDTVKLLSTTWTAPQFRRRLAQLLQVWSSLWKKAPSNTHKSPPPIGKDYLSGGHTSAFRLLQKARDGT